MQRKRVYEDPRPLPGSRAPPTQISKGTALAASEAPATEAPKVASSALDYLDNLLAQELAPKSKPSRSLPASEPETPKSPSANEVIEQSRRRTASRLDQLERLLRTQEAELRKRDEELRKRDDEILTLRHENREIHQFLADYGLQWVGSSAKSSKRASSITSAASSADPTPPASARTAADSSSRRPSMPGAENSGARANRFVAAKSPNSPPPGVVDDAGTLAPAKALSTILPDMERVRRAVSELNALADGTPGEIIKKRDGSHGFVSPSITLSFWQEGLQLDGGALRRYGEPEAVAFLRDFLDGYFPYELKHAYPEGVLFMLVDNSSRPFGAPTHYEWGAGRTLCSRDDSRVRPVDASTPWPPALSSMDYGSAAITSRPAGAACAGAAMGERMWQNPAAAASPTTPGLVGAAPIPVVGAGTTLDGGGAGVSAMGSNGETCRIQIKGPAGQLACVLELAESETLATVHAALQDRSIVKPAAKYELRTAFPSRILTEPSRSLASLGLAPSATLCVRLV
jgi:hypothetical protein